jgi:membrane protein DedA with SNARE-associated domain/rhodanese-related sulfurtransferase
MNHPFDFLVRNGIAVVFAVVFAEQIGIPLPAAPWLLAAGTLIAAGKMNLWMVLAVAVFASLLGDMIWFYLGRYYGHRILRVMCRISLEPDSCVRKTQNVYTRYGMRGIIVAKFIPGFGTIAPPLAGSSGASAVRFACFDALGAFLHEGCFILIGFLFSHQLAQILNALAGLGRSAFFLIVGLAVLWVGYKYFERRLLLGELRMARITVEELYKKQEAGENLMILDLRSQMELKQNPEVIRGALHMELHEIPSRRQEIPHDQDIILYCSCPNEVTSARVALQLRRHGIARVRPLLGGIDAWRARDFPTQLHLLNPMSV